MFTTRDLVLVSLCSGVFLAYGYASGVSLPQAITHSLDLFFLIATLFTILALEIRQSWSATLLGTITGVIFLGTPGAPAPYHITAALVGNGLAFDLCLRVMSRRTIPPSRGQMVAAAAVGHLVMAVVGLSALPPNLTISIIVLPIVPVAPSMFSAAAGRCVKRVGLPPTRST